MEIAELGKEERKIFIIHLIYSIIEGIIFGIVVLNEFVFVKSLQGSNFQLGILIQFSMIVFVFTILLHELIKRYKKKNILRVTALITRLPLFLIVLFPTQELPPEQMVFYHYLFLSIFLFYYSSMTVVNPIINSILKNNYQNVHFGTLYSYATTINKIVMMISTFLFGWLLDYNNFSFVYVYPIMSVLGISSLFLLSTAVKVQYLKPLDKVLSFRNSVRNSFLSIKTIIKTNKPYRHFEIGFMLYGFAFMLTVAITTLFLAEELNLNYSSIAFYKNSYNLIAILMLPFFGKLIDRIDPRKFAAFTFFTLLMYLFFMGLTEYYPYYIDFGNYRFYYLLIISFAWNGLFAATMSLLWNIGSSYFCKNNDADAYQSVHLSMVGLRGMIAPLFGIWLYEYLGFSAVFVLGVFLLAVAIAFMFYSIKRQSLNTIIPNH
ncbi:MFS transporter [Bacteroidota bacterium]